MQPPNCQQAENKETNELACFHAGGSFQNSLQEHVFWVTKHKNQWAHQYQKRQLIWKYHKKVLQELIFHFPAEASLMKHRNICKEAQTWTNYTHQNTSLNRLFRIPFNLYTQPQIFDKNLN